MTSLFYRSIEEPIRKNLNWEGLWKGFDNGLIACWERGRENALNNSELSQSCKNGELPVLAWKGGVDKKIKGKKYGSLFYLATWQGLRRIKGKGEGVRETILAFSFQQES